MTHIIAESGGIPHEGERFENELFSIKILRREGSRLDLVEVRCKRH